jgi:hypothetical protein
MHSANTTWDDDDDEAYTEVLRVHPSSIICRSPRSQVKPHRAKRRKTNPGKAAAAENRLTRASTSLSALLDLFQHGLTIRTARETESDSVIESRNESENQSESDGFESTMEGLLPEYRETRQLLWAQPSDIALPVRLLRRYHRAGCSCSCSAFGVGSGRHHGRRRRRKRARTRPSALPFRDRKDRGVGETARDVSF